MNLIVSFGVPSFPEVFITSPLFRIRELNIHSSNSFEGNPAMLTCICPAGGSYLSEDIRRSSTFTYAAHLALHTGRQVRAPIDIEVLERQLHEWLGEDWKELVENPSMRQAEARRKGGIFN